MKKITFFIISLFVTINIFGQNVYTILYENVPVSQWENLYLDTIAYDVNGYQSNKLTLDWDDSTNTWVNDSRTEYTYNTNGSMQYYIEQNFNTTTNTWVNSYKYSYTYDSIGNLQILLNERWTLGAWQNSLISTYTYDVNGYCINLLLESWSIPLSAWTITYQVDYANKPNGDIEQAVTSIIYANVWSDISRETYTYNGNDSITSILYEHYMGTYWEDYSRNTYSYNLNNLLDTDLEEMWNGSTSSWTDYVFINYYWNADSSLYQTVQQSYDQYGIGWYNSYRKTYTYYSHTSIDEENTIDFNIYPNPSHNYINVEFPKTEQAKIEIYNSQGQQIISQSQKSNKITISISDLPNGVYILNIISGNKISSSQFVKE